nr:MAG TPA: hypothetical protein [Caudoviricetes sp.]
MGARAQPKGLRLFFFIKAGRLGVDFLFLPPQHVIR